MASTLDPVPPVDPSTCIHKCHGYSLYLDENKSPFVLHEYTRRRKLEGVTKHCDRHPLTYQHFEGTATGREAFAALMTALQEYLDWCAANSLPSVRA